MTRSSPSSAWRSSRASSSWKWTRVALMSAAPYPNLPVTYCSVRSSDGWVKICSVGACSTSSPISMNAVVSATRAACCMLCVTITIV